MPQYYTLTWAPGASASTQTIQYRVKNSGSWYTSPNINPANPLGAAVTTADVTDLSTNTVYQFQVLSNCCPGTQSAGAIVEGIIYEQQVFTPTNVAGVISVTQTALPMVDVITYKLVVASAPGVVLQTVTATGIDPSASFTAVGAETYQVKYSYTTVINGVNVNSYDADQNAADYLSNTVVV